MVDRGVRKRMRHLLEQKGLQSVDVRKSERQSNEQKAS